ncbi:MAG TPA: metallophosphoesterase [Candidatus Xenobia bacterium]|jgi:hypothetical protein
MRLFRGLWVALLLGAGLVCAPGRAASPLNVVQWSDIHYGNEEFRPTAWEDACRQGLASHPNVVVLSGDQVDNKCSAAEFQRRLGTFLPDLAARLSGVPVVLALGNNDGRVNYQTSPDTLSETVSFYRKAFGPACYLDDLGNGVLPGSPGGMAWISLNSVVFSDKDNYSGRPQQEETELGWLSRALGRLPARQPVVLVMHVPPVEDVLDHKEAWDVGCLRQLEAILDSHAGPTVILAGHFHRNEIHALALASGRMVPVLLAGSLSGKFGGEPNWRDYRWAPDHIAYTVSYPGHADWTTHYDISRLQRDSTYDELISRLGADDAWYRQYTADFYAHNPLGGLWSENPITRLDLEHELVER